VRLPQPGGFDLPALVHEPREPGGGTVVLLHGGPAATWRAGWDPLVYGLTDAGHRVVQLETRGGTFCAWPVPGLPPGAAAEACDDVAACVAGLVRRGLAAEGAIALMGHSHGAYLAYQASLRLPEVAAVLLSSGYLSSADLEHSPDDDVRRFHRHAFDGVGDDRPARCPVLAVHGEHDLQLPLSVVAATFERLAGDRGRFVVLPAESHAFRDRANVSRWIGVCLGFLGEHLKEHAMTTVSPAGHGGS
jgi:dipeptidyl aminopeptidase/acylaminoacyl peptidase